MKSRKVFLFGAILAIMAVAPISASFLFHPRQSRGDQVTNTIQQAAQATTQIAPLINGGKPPSAGLVTGANIANAVAPAVSQGVAGVQAANGDPAAVVEATAAAVSQASAAAAAVPTPWTGYLLLASIIANLIGGIIAGFTHSKTVTAVAASSGASPATT